MFVIIYSCAFHCLVGLNHGYKFKFLPNTKLAQIYFPFSDQYPQTFHPITLPAFSPLPSEFPFTKNHYFLMVCHPSYSALENVSLDNFQRQAEGMGRMWGRNMRIPNSFPLCLGSRILFITWKETSMTWWACWEENIFIFQKKGEDLAFQPFSISCFQAANTSLAASWFEIHQNPHFVNMFLWKCTVGRHKGCDTAKKKFMYFGIFCLW